MSRPIIGITKPDNEDLLAYATIYASVKLVGGKAVVMTPSCDYESYDLDGLLVGGGKDVFPELYGDNPKDDYAYDHKRDSMEVFWAERALEENIPTLGICRGAQLLNVMCGGSLHMQVKDAYEDADYPDGFFHHTFFRKQITLNTSGKLFEITKQKHLSVNSIHKQAINKLGKNLQIDASEKNGVIQAISHKSHPFFLGVQFHPEFLIYKSIFRKIFATLVDAAKSKSQNE